MDKDREFRKLNRLTRGAQSFVLWGLIGVLFPLFGLIFGAMAVKRTREIEEDYSIDEQREDKLRDIRNQGYVIMVLSVISFATWYLVLINV